MDIKLNLFNKDHPVSKQKWSIGQRAADRLTAGMGSWTFIIFFLLVLVVWIIINSYFLIKYTTTGAFDPFPFILLNLVLSCLAAIQAPIILMSQNREAQKDRLRAEYDYQVNRKAEKEIQQIQYQLIEIEKKIIGTKTAVDHNKIDKTKNSKVIKKK